LLIPKQVPAQAQRHATFPLARIRVGERFRRDMGDVASLAASMGSELGLLHPVVIRPDGTLIAGQRRLYAAKLLGWSEIPVNVIDLDAVVRGEYAENVHRKDFTLSEAVAIKRALEPVERAAAKDRQREGGRRGGEGSGKLPEASTGNAADKAAKATGMARRTLEKAEAIVDAAEAEPEKYGKLLADMDRTKRVNGVYRRLKISQQAEIIRAEPPPLPGNGPYRCAVVDPPWADDTGRYDDPSHRLITPYPPMTLEEICAFPLASILMPDAIVWIWFTNYHVHRGIHRTVLDAFGLQSKAMLTWGKPHIGGGDSLRGQTEQCILAVRGNPVVTLTNQSTLLLAPSREGGGHSLKPKEFYDVVESLCPAPRYADLFSRYRHNDKWDCHGDQAPLPHPLDIPDFPRRAP
jgi:N6-adenosine-specific RNA methylase IME4